MKPPLCGVPARSFLAPEYREASAIVNQIVMIDLPTRARMSRAENRYGFARCSAPTIRPTRSHLGGADAGVAPTSTNGRSSPRVAVARLKRATDW